MATDAFDVSISRKTKKGRPPQIRVLGAQQLVTRHCPVELKLQLIKESDRMGLSLSMYIAMVLHGVGQEVRQAAVFELAMELEQKGKDVGLRSITESQVDAFEAELLKNVNQEEWLVEQEKAEAEELLSKIGEFEI